MPTPHKPSVIKALEGNRGKFGRQQVKTDPKGIGRPRVADYLKPAEKALYRAVIEALPVTILSRADESCLERFAVAWARFRYAHGEVHRVGHMVQSPFGPVVNPYLSIMERASKEMHRAGGELGLSPVARARMATISTVEDDPMALLLGDDMDPTGAWSTPPRARAN